MRAIGLAILLLGLQGCAADLAPAPPYRTVNLPYSACGQMASLRTNLTGGPYPSAKSDAELWSLGVRCIGTDYSTYSAVRARY
jgi:hypothetical protein